MGQATSGTSARSPSPAAPTTRDSSSCEQSHLPPSPSVSAVEKQFDVLSLLPFSLPEQAAIEKLDEAREAAMPYLSRRRAVPERIEVLRSAAFPSPHPPATTVARPRSLPLPLPDPQFCTYEELWLPGVRERVHGWLESARTALHAKRIKGPPALIIPAERALQPWALNGTWDCRDPARCFRIQPSTPDDPPPSALNAAFIREEAAKIEWPDEDLLYQVAAGADDGAKLNDEIVLCYHHNGLIKEIEAAREAVRTDLDKGLIHFFPHLPFLPFRCVPKNIALAQKWVVAEDGTLSQKLKKRFTTDDSWTARDQVISRNAGIEQAAWPELVLPSTRDLGVAAAILSVPADEAGVPLRAYARDLQAAYRAWGVQRATLPLQGFVFDEGVGLDVALEFGTASSPQLFERLASLLLAIAQSRQRDWDAAHPPNHPALRAWLARRGSPSLGYAHIFIDDSAGVVIDDIGDSWPEGRARVHFDIVGEVFTQAGFVVPPDKDQLSQSPLTLGFRLCLGAGERKVDYPPEKTAVLRALISRMRMLRVAPRQEVEQVVGILGHLTTIVPEGRLYLSACYALIYARRHGTTSKPALLHVAGKGRVVGKFREALEWFEEALATGVSVPLAPRTTFPSMSEPGAAFLFKDASREWGVGGWSLLPTNPPTFILLAARYPRDLQMASMDKEATGLSTGALEMAAYVITAAALRRHTTFSSLITFTDSESARGAANAGSSRSAAMRPLLDALFAPGEQHLAVRVATEENRWADMASRGRAREVAAEAGRLGWIVRWEEPTDEEWEPLRKALRAYSD